MVCEDADLWRLSRNVISTNLGAGGSDSDGKCRDDWDCCDVNGPSGPVNSD